MAVEITLGVYHFSSEENLSFFINLLNHVLETRKKSLIHIHILPQRGQAVETVLQREQTMCIPCSLAERAVSSEIPSSYGFFLFCCGE